ncbi:hypothetical protein B0G76_1310 [Paraburkholderia sp. BL23I1N1]|uniref:hypothetical protein n=1 Tax=Paraburkholderia sp. BL23I1N1 TaxID=1938802 RepID=UPI000E75158E|nr:hypothetical protein [Paraburkholderia sp. BL23I1N1]RKE35249.1 hypothetical protein B0G76_1310 [Paraburkholderia sp. BL23I1N1]
MRPTPVRLPDELLAPACLPLGAGNPDAALLNPALRAAVQAAVRAQLNPNPRASRRPPRRGAGAAYPQLDFSAPLVDIKKRAANDLDGE